MLTAFRLDWLLPEEVFTFAELGVELFVQVVPVGNDYNGRFVKNLLYQMGVEDHGETLSASLRVPEHADFSVTFRCGKRSFHSFPYCEILMIGSKDFSVTSFIFAETCEVLCQVQKSFLGEHSLEESVIVHEIGSEVLSVFRFPFHVAVFLGGDCAGLGARHVAHYAEDIVCEHGWDFQNVVPDLFVCIGGFRFFP